MPELDYITIQGFKSIGSIEKFPLSAINVVIGANGSGKSNFIEVFSFLHSIREGRLQDYVGRAGGAERLLHFGSKVTKRLAIKLSFQSETNQYGIALVPREGDQLYPSSEVVSFWNKARYGDPLERSLPRHGMEAGISTPGDDRVGQYVHRHLGRWRVYHFHDTSSSSPMKATADLNDNHYLRADGSNLPAFLYYLQQRHEASYGLIQRTVKLVAPFFEDFRLGPQQLNPEKIRLEWSHKGSDAYFDASSLSDGTLRFVALATLFLQPDQLRPSVIVVDEPELGLHPYAITILGSLVKQASVRTQVILSTQSSFLLDQFSPEDVIVAERIRERTEFARLETETLSTWLEDYSLGQLWEKNEIGGRPNGV
jgi:predicted ATPase